MDARHGSVVLDIVFVCCLLVFIVIVFTAKAGNDFFGF